MNIQIVIRVVFDLPHKDDMNTCDMLFRISYVLGAELEIWKFPNLDISVKISVCH